MLYDSSACCTLAYLEQNKKICCPCSCLIQPYYYRVFSHVSLVTCSYMFEYFLFRYQGNGINLRFALFSCCKMGCLSRPLIKLFLLIKFKGHQDQSGHFGTSYKIGTNREGASKCFEPKDVREI